MNIDTMNTQLIGDSVINFRKPPDGKSSVSQMFPILF